MIWNTRYLPPDPHQWRGRPDIPPNSSFFQIIQILNLLEDKFFELKQPAFALIGFRCDEGVKRNHGRVGAAEGPAAIRHALSRLPVQNQNFMCFDAGNITCADGDLEASQHALGSIIAFLLQHNVIPIVMGGGHELAWGHYQGIARTHPTSSLGIVNFDAHFDMRPLLPENKGSSGTPFLQIANARESANLVFDYNCVGIQHAGNIRQLFETAKAHNTKIILADELHQGQQEKCIDFIDRVIDQNELIYVTVCLDVFNAAYAPGVSASQPLGLDPWQVIPLIRQLAASGKVISFDIAELAPRYDVDHRTSKLAANLIYEFIHNYHTRTW
ncbi:MAG: formimidoylglutamase [Gammaproteobacteria bacterium]|nr:formimidoylglutamase [Gammaproteobacteria bacterium]